MNVYFDKLVGILNSLDNLRQRFFGSDGRVVLKSQDNLSGSIKQALLINDSMVVVEDEAQAETARTLGGPFSVIYNTTTRLIEVLEVNVWVTYPTVYLSQYVQGGVFYLDINRSQLYWAEVNGGIIKIPLRLS